MVVFFSIIDLLASIIAAVMGATVLFWNPRAALNKVFSLFCFSIAYWAFMEAQLRHSSSYSEAFVYIHLLFLFPISVALFLHFTLILAGRERILHNPLTYFLIYVPTGAIALSYYLTDKLRGAPVLEPWGWSYGAFDWSFVHNIQLIFLQLLTIAALYFCLKFYLGQTDRIARLRARYVLIGLAIPVVTGSVTEVLLPLVRLKVPEMTNTGFAVGCAGFIGYAIIKYDLFVTSPAISPEKVVAAMSDSLLFVNNEGTIVSANRASVSMLGYEKKELIGKDFADLCEECTSQFRPLADIGKGITQVSRMETRLRSGQGRSIPVSVAFSPTFDGRGRLRGHIIIARDIAEQKEAEDALRKSEARYRTLFETSPEGIAVIDQGGKILMCNQVLPRLLGYGGPEEIIGRHNIDFVATEERQRTIESLGEVIAGNLRNMEFNALKKDGTITPAEVRVSPVSDLHENPQTFLCVIRDIAERKASEESLRESEELFRGVFEEGPLGMAFVDHNLKFVKINATLCKMVGYSEEELLGRSFADITHPDDVTKDVESGKKMLRGELPSYKTEKRYIRKDGSLIWVSLTASIIRDKQGNPLYTLGLVGDITDRKQFEQQILEQSQQLQDANEELLAYNRVSNVISQSIELERLLPAVLATVTGLNVFNVIRRGGIMLVEGDRMQLVAHLGHPQDFIDAHQNLGLEDCLCGLAARTGEVITSTCAFDDGRHTIRYPGMEDHGHVILPLRVADHVVGVMYLYMPADAEINEARRQLLINISNQLGIAIENAQLFEKTRALSLHDQLTGLANRNLMNIELENNFVRARRTGAPFSLIMLDMDFFKKYNDKYGHKAGDRLLSEIGAILTGEVREVDLATRYGGEEFLIILPDTGITAATEVAERIRSRIGSTDFIPEGQVKATHITVSLGVACFDENITNPGMLVEQADRCLYRAKHEGRNRTESLLPN